MQILQRQPRTIIGLTLAASLVCIGCSGAPAPEPTSSVEPTVSSSASQATQAPASKTPAQQSSSPSPAATSSEPASDGGLLGEPSLADKQQPPADTQHLVVSEVRVGKHDGFERVVFETAGAGQAGWFASLTTEPRQPGSGFPIDYEGDIALWIAIRGVSYPWDAGRPEFDGYVAGQGGVITGVSNQKSYEGQHEFTIGLAREVPYSITWLDNPGRVVVDFKTS